MHNFIGIRNKTNNFKKGFYVDQYDEPTYLTFAIDFKFEATGDLSKNIDDILWESPLFDAEYGTVNYLQNRNKPAEAKGLVVFKELLRYLTFDAPWYFQKLGGLDELWKISTDMSKGTKEAKITVDTLEAVDLRITQLADLYRNAIYDKVYLRERVPDNLRWFSMDIYVAESRNLRFRLPGLLGTAASTVGFDSTALSKVMGGGNTFTNVLKEYGYVKFRCRQCEFDFSESFAGGQSMDVGLSGQPATNKFGIKIGYFEEESKYMDGTELFDSSSKTKANNKWVGLQAAENVQNAYNVASGIPALSKGLENAGQKAKSSLEQIGGLINPALNAAANLFSPPVTNLGQVYSETIPKK
jgi:hypothetical protein